jgi:hypothetical protein
VWGILGNIDVNNARATGHLVKLCVLHEGHWFSLARYHDSGYGRRGPDALASFLRLPIDEVFPIMYDITFASQGDHAALRESILKEPREKLTDNELMSLL